MIATCSVYWPMAIASSRYGRAMSDDQAPSWIRRPVFALCLAAAAVAGWFVGSRGWL